MIIVILKFVSEDNRDSSILIIFHKELQSEMEKFIKEI